MNYVKTIFFTYKKWQVEDYTAQISGKVFRRDHHRLRNKKLGRGDEGHDL